MISLSLIIMIVAIYTFGTLLVFFGALGASVPLFVTGLLINIFGGTLAIYTFIEYAIQFTGLISSILSFAISIAITVSIYKYLFKK